MYGDDQNMNEAMMKKMKTISSILLILLSTVFFSSCEEEESDDTALISAALYSTQNSNIAFYWLFKSNDNAVRCVELDVNYADKQAEYTERMNSFVSKVNASSYAETFSMDTGSGGCPDMGTVVAKCTSYGYGGIEGNRIYKTNESGLSVMPAVYTALGSGAPWSTNVKAECEEGSPIQGATGTFECYDSSLCGSY